MPMPLDAMKSRYHVAEVSEGSEKIPMSAVAPRAKMMMARIMFLVVVFIGVRVLWVGIAPAFGIAGVFDV